jgi:anti-sigma regulatory factor (Ser/Thr protein kinase)
MGRNLPTVRTGEAAVHIDLQLPGGPMAPKLARTAVGKLGERLPDDLLDDVRLLVSELVTNSVLHGRAGPTDTVRLRLVSDASTVRLEVTDPGPGMPHRTPQPREDQTGGWGLLLVDRVADRWGVRPERPSTVWAELST